MSDKQDFARCFCHIVKSGKRIIVGLRIVCKVFVFVQCCIDFFGIFCYNEITYKKRGFGREK